MRAWFPRILEVSQVLCSEQIWTCSFSKQDIDLIWRPASQSICKRRYFAQVRACTSSQHCLNRLHCVGTGDLRGAQRAESCSWSYAWSVFVAASFLPFIAAHLRGNSPPSPGTPLTGAPCLMTQTGMRRFGGQEHQISYAISNPSRNVT